MLTHDPSTLHQGEKLPVPTEQRLGEPHSRTGRLEDRSPALAENQTLVSRTSSPYPSDYADYAYLNFKQGLVQGSEENKELYQRGKIVVYGTEVRTLDLPVQKTC